METVVYYEIMKHADVTGKHSTMKPTGIVFKKEKDAKDFVRSSRYKPYGVYGSEPLYPHGFSVCIKRHEVEVHKDLAEFDALKKEKKLCDLLGKLGEEEKDMLREHFKSEEVRDVLPPLS